MTQLFRIMHTAGKCMDCVLGQHKIVIKKNNYGMFQLLQCTTCKLKVSWMLQHLECISKGELVKGYLATAVVNLYPGWLLSFLCFSCCTKIS